MFIRIVWKKCAQHKLKDKLKLTTTKSKSETKKVTD